MLPTETRTGSEDRQTRCASWLDSVRWRRERIAASDLLGRLPAVSGAASEGEDGAMGGEREVSVCFVDLRGFTRHAESHRPEEIHAFLSRYVHVVSEIVRAYGGTVVEFQGDGVVVAFGALDELAKKERAALQASCVILNAMRALGLAVGIGIATGPAYVGHLESLDRRAFCVLGTPTLMAARLQSLARQLGAAVVVDGHTFQAGGPFDGFRFHAGVEVRGSERRHDVYALPDGAGGDARRGACMHPVARRALVRVIVTDPERLAPLPPPVREPALPSPREEA